MTANRSKAVGRAVGAQSSGWVMAEYNCCICTVMPLTTLCSGNMTVGADEEPDSRACCVTFVGAYINPGGFLLQLLKQSRKDLICQAAGGK